LKKIAALTGVIGFAAGILVGVVCLRANLLEFVPRITLGEVVNAILAVLLLGVVTTYLQKRFSDDRSKKDLIFRLGYAVLDNLSELEQSLRHVDASADLSETARADLDHALTSLSNGVGMLEGALKKCAIDLQSSGFNDLNGTRQELRELITNDPYPLRLDGSICRATQAPLRSMRTVLCNLLLTVNEQ
jgi:hypothetical protein